MLSHGQTPRKPPQTGKNIPWGAKQSDRKDYAPGQVQRNVGRRSNESEKNGWPPGRTKTHRREKVIRGGGAALSRELAGVTSTHASLSFSLLAFLAKDQERTGQPAVRGVASRRKEHFAARSDRTQTAGRLPPRVARKKYQSLGYP